MPINIPSWIVFHVPHDSTYIPADIRKQFVLTDKQLSNEILKMTDHHTLDLFTRGIAAQQIVHAKVNRLVVDVERFAEDDMEKMSSIGMGVTYVRTHHGEKLRQKLTDTERNELLGKWYYPHHKALTNAVDKALEKFGKCLVVDCHSFPLYALPFELDQATDRPQFCIGSDAFHTPRPLIENMLKHLQKNNFAVKENSPFAGSLVPMKHYQKDKRVSAVMIEIRRDLYMNEANGEKLPAFEEMASVIQNLLLQISEFRN